MPPNKRSQEIASAFSGYAKAGDKELIEHFTKEEIGLALIQYSADKRFPHYSAMESRLGELKEQDKKFLSLHERRKVRIEGIMIGVIVTVVGGLILALLLKGLGWN